MEFARRNAATSRLSVQFGVSCCNSRCLLIAQVSWIRQRDLHILTVGILTYTNDQRFQSLHSDGSDEWTLKISSPQTRDSGIYECQVSTEPKISQAFNLSVVGTCAYLSFYTKIRSIAPSKSIGLWIKSSCISLRGKRKAVKVNSKCSRLLFRSDN